MIVKNEEEKLRNCLACARNIIDEIIIVDTGSTDKTKNIAFEFTDKVFDFEWINDFSAARNFSFSKATKEYILWLDADDIILPIDLLKFLSLKKTLPQDIDIVMMKYNTGFDYKGKCIFSCLRERLVKREKTLKWIEPVHEYIEMRGKIIETDIAITHTVKPRRLSGRNLQIYENLIADNIPLSPRGNYYYARELKDHNKYSQAINQFQFFLNTGLGWIEDNITACFELSILYQIDNKPKQALNALLKSFEYAPPRPEICCQLGFYFKQHKKYDISIFWFNLALTAQTSTWGFNMNKYQNCIPLTELSNCYSALNNTEKSLEYLEQAKKYEC